MSGMAGFGARARVLGRVQRLLAISLAVFCAALACGPRGEGNEPVGMSSSAVGTCGSDSLSATYLNSQTRTYTHQGGWPIVVPGTVGVAGGSWTGIAGATLNFTTASGTVSCGYQESGSGTTSTPFAFLFCEDSWNGWQDDGGPGTVLTVTAVEVTADCFTGTCSGSPSVTGSWAYVDPGWSNPCQTVTCSGGSNGPVQTPADVADGTACAPDACHATAACQSGQCTDTNPLPTDDGNPCTDDSTCDPVSGVTHTFDTAKCPVPSGAATGDTTVPTNFATSTSFLYTGANAIQKNFNTTIDAKRASVVRGRVIDRDGGVAPNATVVPNIKVSILGHDEYGWTLTRSDGYFDLAVNGGETYTLQFVCDTSLGCPAVDQTSTPKYVTAHRQAKTRWLDYTVLDDVAVFAKDTASTITPDSGAWQSARASAAITDSNGSRTATLLVPPSTHATNLTASQYTVRLTEATAGAQDGTTNGPAAMPADLPPQSGYTYAVEMSMDEAEAQGLTSVTFNNPMLFYVENFIGAPLDGDAGATVPAGYYDREAGAWQQDQLDGGPAQNGRSLKIIGVATDAESNPAAQLSLDGVNEISNYADPSIVPAIADGEREKLASIYCPGQTCPSGGVTLWRVPVEHFTPWDYNYAEAFPIDAIAPPADKPYANSSPQDPKVSCGSIIECEGMVLGEEIPIAGTPFSLHYRSEQQAGFWPTLVIPLSDSVLPMPDDLDRIELDLQVAGVDTKFKYKSPPQHLVVSYPWAKVDAYDRPVQGSVLAHITISYVYNLEANNPKGSVETTTVFGTFGNGSQIAHRGREARVSTTYDVPLGAFDAKQLGLGGWTLSANHVFETQSNTIWRGDGGKQVPAARADVIEQALTTPTAYALEGLAAGPDGTIYVGQHGGNGLDNVAKLVNGALTRRPLDAIPWT